MKNTITEILKVDGMTCHNCEKTVEKALGKLDGVVKVKASFHNRNVIIKYNPAKINKKDISSAIESVGYTIVDSGSNKFVIITFIILLGLYLILKNTGLFNFVPEIEDSIGYGLLFVVGLLTSIHCIAMCGGINISVSMAQDGNKFKPGLLYNLGRVTSYTIIGCIVGAIGSTISFSPSAKDTVSVLAGLFMIILGVSMSGLLTNRNLNVHLPKFITRFLNKLKKNTKSPYIIGILNGLMPCGPLQTMQLYALGTGSILKGALSMFIFSLGTVPLMLGLSSLSGFMSGKMGVKLKKLSGILVVILGIVMFNRGFDYSIFTKLTTQTINPNATVATIKDGYQEVVTRFEYGRYQPIVVQKGIPVKWTIVIEKGDLNGCNNPFVLPFGDETIELTYGNNLIEFAPDEVGNFRYHCWMNMISSYIYVVDDIATINQ